MKIRNSVAVSSSDSSVELNAILAHGSACEILKSLVLPGDAPVLPNDWRYSLVRDAMDVCDRCSAILEARGYVSV